MSVASLNGGSAVAMTGKECVAIASDKRFGLQMTTINMDFPKVFEMGPRLYCALTGLQTDVLTVSEKLRFQTKMFELRENRRIDPPTFATMTSNLLYQHRFGPYYIEPVVAGLDPHTFEPLVASADLLGCIMMKDDFVVAGTASSELYGMCEVLWHKDMNPDELLEAISQSMLNALDRDAASGWGVVVHLVEKDQVTVHTLKARMD